MKFKIFFLFLFIIGSQSISFAQNQQKIDSLFRKLSSANDTTKINLTNKIASLYIDTYPDSTFKYANFAYPSGLEHVAHNINNI